MPDQIQLYSFADVDRSGKVRWTAREIGLDIEEKRIRPGQQTDPDYLKLNPYAQIPTCIIGDEVLIESTAICLVLAERYPAAELIPEAGPQREAFWQSMALATTSLEQPVVSYYLSRSGFIEADWAELLEKPLRKRLGILQNQLPESSYLHEAFSLADICTAYVLRIAVSAGLLELKEPLAGYLALLRQRPAAIDAQFFDDLDA